MTRIHLKFKKEKKLKKDEFFFLGANNLSLPMLRRRIATIRWATIAEYARRISLRWQTYSKLNARYHYRHFCWLKNFVLFRKIYYSFENLTLK